jgi:carbon-monoxide dehydrogenase small subunit
LKKILINLIVNGVDHEILAKPHWTLAYVLREILNLNGTKVACGTGDCGCCTVIMNGKAVLSCLTLAVKAEGAEIQTIEDLASGGRLNPIQLAFTQDDAVQCGYCIPGMIMNMKAFLDENPDSDEAELRRVLGGNICRCTGYAKQVEAVLKARDIIAMEGKRSD